MSGEEPATLLECLHSQHAGLQNVQDAQALHYLNVLKSTKAAKAEVGVGRCVCVCVCVYVCVCGCVCVCREGGGITVPESLSGQLDLQRTSWNVQILSITIWRALYHLPPSHSLCPANRQP